MKRGNGFTIIVALLCVSLVHAGAYVGLTAVGQNNAISLIQEGDASMLTMHQFQLNGVSEAVEGNAEDSAEAGEDVPKTAEPEETIEPIEEPVIEEPVIEEPVIEETIVEPEPVVEPVVVPEPIKEPEPVIEAPVEKIVATEAPSEQKVVQPKAPVEKPKSQPKPKPKMESKPTPKPTPKPKAGAESNRAAQQAKAVYSETDVSVLSKPLPGYPRSALQRRMQGTVVVIIQVSAQGVPQSAKIARSSGHKLLDSAAEKAAMKVRLKPVKINGVATPINVTISYQFKL